MKSKLTLLMIAIIAIGFSSCTKEYTCKCTATYYLDGSLAQESEMIYEGTEKAAKEECEEQNEDIYVYGLKAKQECKIK